jgi:deferrochelatase/peroxidase EfeB
MQAIRIDDGLGSRVVAGSTGDPFGVGCPTISHIRKVNPRDRATNKGSGGRTLQFQMLRRGITYGPLFDPANAQADRGLLFLAYMTSFQGQFLILNTDWMNNAAAP